MVSVTKVPVIAGTGPGISIVLLLNPSRSESTPPYNMETDDVASLELLPAIRLGTAMS